MMSLATIKHARESFREAQAEARQRDERVQAILDERQRAQESPNNQLLVKATSENEAYVFTLGHGMIPGNIRMFNAHEALVRVHCSDIRLLQRWFAEHLTAEY